MGKEERKARRQERRRQRKEYKSNRKEEFKKLIAAAKDFDADELNEDNFQESFQEIWKVLDPALMFAFYAGITGPRLDNRLKQVHEIGESIYEGDNGDEVAFRQKFAKIWKVAEPILEVVDYFVNDDKVEDIIDKIEDAGDLIAGED